MNQRYRFLLICLALFTILAACQGDQTSSPTAVSTPQTPLSEDRTETIDIAEPTAEPTAVPDFLAWEFVGSFDLE
ncbi:MAG: hypothetical protein KC445_08740, partial [Anaerolineales bacterium]|nr:hypothetical protein [Anaerolineales bacterium]